MSENISNQKSGLEDGGSETSSYFSERHLSKEQKEFRTSTYLYTFSNVIKLFLGIAFLNTPQNVANMGVYGSILALSWVLALNLVGTYMMIKARNKFKYTQIRNLSDLV